jgi:hypothetical protein
MTLVVVSGAIANKPRQGGEAWVRLSWVRGLAKLGYDVYFLEQLAASAFVDAEGHAVAFQQSAGRTYFEQVTGEFGLSGRAALVFNGGEDVFGAAFRDLENLASNADLLINISGHLRLDSLLQRFRRKVYIDIDPGFTQFWHADPKMPFEVAGHDDYYTIGENIGSPGCTIPTGGIRWRPIRQPIVLEDWPVVRSEVADRFTTVANWRGPFGPIEYQGHTFGLKVHEFRKFIELPRRAPYTFELALNLHAADDKDRRMLVDYGWRLANPHEAAADPSAFRGYVQKSSAEFSVAQGVYVETNSGWFSDRSVRYLASGKPVLVQDTGLAGRIPLGEGLHVFRTLDEAVENARRIVDGYDEECAAARRIAERCFDSDRVLGRLMDEVGLKP